MVRKSGEGGVDSHGFPSKGKADDSSCGLIECDELEEE